MKFQYQSTKKLAPRNGNRFATTYYNMTHEQRRRLREHIQRVRELVITRLTPEQRATPLTGHRKTDGSGEYTIQEVIDGFLAYLEEGNDPPSGHLGRWQAIFGSDPDFSIELTRFQPETNQFRSLFQCDE